MYSLENYPAAVALPTSELVNSAARRMGARSNMR